VIVSGRDPAPGAEAGTLAEKNTRDINVLLLGVDERSGDVGRSDTIMLLNYNALWGTLHLMSIPRDTRVKLPDHGHQKINAAYAYGGPELAKQAVGELTGLYIDYYLKVNFDGFTGVVDALGGVDIDVKQRMSYTDPYQDLRIDFEPGRQHLDGKKALEYVRYRGDARSDLARVERQREFVAAAFKKALNPFNVFRIPALITALDKCVDTDIPALIKPGLASNVALAFRKGVETCTGPGTTATIGGGSYFIADEDEMAKVIAAWSDRPVRQPESGEEGGESKP